MHAERLPTFTVLVASALLALPVAAQTSPTLRPGDRYVGAWAGASFYAPGGTRLGGISDRDLYLAGARAEWVLESNRSFALAATMDAIPLAVVTRNPTYTDSVIGYAMGRKGRVSILQQTGRAPVYGLGASPLGLEVLGPSLRAVRPYFSAAAGFLWFTRNTPAPETRRLNGTFELGLGFRVAQGEHHAWLLGYKFHHLSNAWTAPYNPGLDGNVFYLGLMRRR